MKSATRMCFCPGLLASMALALQPAAYSQAFLPSPVQFYSTVPANGDLNPYGVATVPWNFPAGGLLNPGDILVSNFNSSQNLQGTGTTIVQITGGQQQLFYQSTGTATGLSGALTVLSSGYVVVGAFPTADGTCATAGAGSLLVLDKNGNLVLNWSAAAMINGPWGMAVDDQGEFARLFVSNALTGTVVRINLWALHGTLNVQSVVQTPGTNGVATPPRWWLARLDSCTTRRPAYSTSLRPRITASTPSVTPISRPPTKARAISFTPTQQTFSGHWR